MRILFLHEVGYFEKPIFEMHELPEHLASRGHEIGFVDFLEKRASHSTRFGELVSGRVLQDSKLRLYSQRIVIPGIFGRLMAVFAFPLFFNKALKEFEPDLVVSYSIPTSGWQALLLCWHARIPFIFRALDVSHKIRRTTLAPLVKVAERFIYQKSTWVSCNNAAMQDYCVSLGASRERSSIEWPPLDLAHFFSQDRVRLRLRNRLGILEEETVVVYMGSFFYFSGLDRVITQMSRFQEKVRLVLIGGGEQETELRELVSRLNLDHCVTFTGFVGFDDLPDFLSIGNVAINPMHPFLVSHAALPNKVLQYMAVGLPVVSTNLRGLASVFSGVEGLRFVISADEVLEESITIASSPRASQMGRENRRLIAETFDKDKNIDAFEALIQAVRRSN